MIMKKMTEEKRLKTLTNFYLGKANNDELIEYLVFKKILIEDSSLINIVTGGELISNLDLELSINDLRISLKMLNRLKKNCGANIN